MIQKVTARFPYLKYMTHAQAEFLRGIVLGSGARNLLELGTHHGKSAAYLAAILDEVGGGKVTTLDVEACMAVSPNVDEVLGALGLRNRVEVLLHHRSLTMTLLAMLDRSPRERFDFCYFDAGHTWDVTGFAFLLVDRMLRPGAWVLFDDLDWTLGAFIARDPKGTERMSRYGPEELGMPQVRKVFEILVRDLGYTDMSEPRRGWGLARKPAANGISDRR